MRFLSREDAGTQLGTLLKDRHIEAAVVLGLPRGGVIVAKQVAAVLDLPLDVVVVRKIGHPWFREYAVGALAENGITVLDHRALGFHPVPQSALEAVMEEEQERLAVYQTRFHPAPFPDITSQPVLLVDDGLATGWTMEAAVRSLKSRQVSRVIVAAPVASVGAYQRLNEVADALVVLCVDPGFEAVGQYYTSFLQTTDAQVLAALAGAQVAHSQRHR